MGFGIYETRAELVAWLRSRESDAQLAQQKSTTHTCPRCGDVHLPKDGDRG